MNDPQRQPGRPRKWSSDAERMRAYRAGQRERTARLVDPAGVPEALMENRRLRERLAQLEDERDRLWAQIVRLHGELRARAMDHQMPETRVDGEPSGLAIPRAERRRREREAARRERRRT